MVTLLIMGLMKAESDLYIIIAYGTRGSRGEVHIWSSWSTWSKSSWEGQTMDGTGNILSTGDDYTTPEPPVTPRNSRGWGWERSVRRLIVPGRAWNLYTSAPPHATAVRPLLSAEWLAGGLASKPGGVSGRRWKTTIEVQIGEGNTNWTFRVTPGIPTSSPLPSSFS